MCEDTYMTNLKLEFDETIKTIRLIDDDILDLEYDEEIQKIISKKQVQIKNERGSYKNISKIYTHTGTEEIKLSNGEYIPMNIVKKTLIKKLQMMDEDAIIENKSTNKILTKEEVLMMVLELLKDSSRLYLSFGNKNITNQKTARLSIKGKTTDKFLSKGLLMLGKEGINLSYGEYVNKNDLDLILSNFSVKQPEHTKEVVGIFAKTKEKVIYKMNNIKKSTKNLKEKCIEKKKTIQEGFKRLLEKGTDRKEKTEYKIINIRKSLKELKEKCIEKKDQIQTELNKRMEKGKDPKQKYKVQKTRKSWKKKGILISAGLAGIATLTLLSGMKIKFPKTEEKQVTDYFTYQDCTIREREEEPIYETEEEMWQRVLSNYEIGQETTIEKGVHFYESSDFAFGGANNFGIHQTKDYNVESFSILGKGQILKTNCQNGTNLYSLAKDIKNEHNLEYQDLTYMINCDSTGWVSINEKDNLQDLQPEIINSNTVLRETYQTSSLTVGIATFEINGEKVTIKTSDQYNRPLQKNTIVKGSNNKEYEIQNVSKRTVTANSTIEVENDWEINWKLKNIKERKEILLASLAMFAAVSGARELAKGKVKQNPDDLIKKKVLNLEK